MKKWLYNSAQIDGSSPWLLSALIPITFLFWDYGFFVGSLVYWINFAYFSYSLKCVKNLHLSGYEVRASVVERAENFYILGLLIIFILLIIK